MEMLQGVWKQHLRPRAVVGYGVKIFLPSPPNYVTRSPGCCRNQESIGSACEMGPTELLFTVLDQGDILKLFSFCWRVSIIKRVRKL